MSKSPIQLPKDIVDALSSGRAFPLLVGYRDPSIPGLSITTVGHIDLQQIIVVLASDDEKTEEWKSLPLEGSKVVAPFPIKSDAQDANTVHALWSNWHSGGQHDSLAFLESVGAIVRRQRLLKALDISDQKPDLGRDTQGRKPKKPKAGARRGTKAKRGVK